MITTLDKIINRFFPLARSFSTFTTPIALNIKRDDLASLFNELGFKVGAEIGVYTGRYSESLCSKNPNLKLYCIDPWEVYETKADDPHATDEKQAHYNYEKTKKRMAKYNCELIKKTSMEAIKDFEPESLDFVYIDANHDYEHVSEDIEAWAKIVKHGGIVSGHDYGHWKDKTKNLEAKRAVDEYIAKHNKILFLVNKVNQTNWFFCK
jgi:predicted O-methyltransferase YrrM